MRDVLRQAFEDELQHWLQRKGPRKALHSFFVYLLPAFFVQWFLTELSGGALLLPPSWRALVIVVSVLTGQAFFNLSRSSPARMLHPRDGDLEGDAVEEHGPTTGKRARRDAKQEPRRELRRRAMVHRRNRSVLPWLLAGIVVVLGQTFLRVRCVVPIDIPYEVADATGLLRDPLPYFLVRDRDVPGSTGEGTPSVEFGRGAVLAREPNGGALQAPELDLTGTLLYPLWIGNSSTRARIESIERDTGVRWIEHYMDNDPNIVIEAIQVEQWSMAVTIAVFAVVHLLLVASLSMAYGRMFSVPDEAGAKLAGILT